MPALEEKSNGKKKEASLAFNAHGGIVYSDLLLDCLIFVLKRCSWSC